MQTEVIRYNLQDRGRRFRGKPRNFDIPRIVAAINSGVTQEKVKHRDMLGYYGHWPRIKFGMNLVEGGVIDGKAVRVEPALVTTHLKAFEDGTIEHQADFLDTEAGKVAASLYKSKTGGFSSAIDEHKMPPVFYGFDYVLEPNFSTNRGYEVALDSVSDATLDAIEAIEGYQEHVGAMARLLDCVQQDRDQIEEGLRDALKVIATLEADNEQYRSMLMKGRTLDSLESVTEMPILVPRNRAAALRATIDAFSSAELVMRQTPQDPVDQPDSTMRTVVNYVMGR